MLVDGANRDGRGGETAGSHRQLKVAATVRARRPRPSFYQGDPALDAEPIRVGAARRRLSLLAQLALVPLIFLLGPRLAQATIFVTPSSALVGRADAIALGAVRSVTPRWEGGRIVSDVQLDVAQTIKGELPQTVTIAAPGGKIGDVVMRVIGGASFQVGDRSIVFLTKQGGVHRLLGLGAGKLDVYSRDGRELVAWSHDGAVEEAPLARVLKELTSLAAAEAR